MGSVEIHGADGALEMVHQNPRGALELALEVQRSSPLDLERAKAHWAAGMAHRELGDLANALGEFTLARQLADRTRDNTLAARITVSLALAHAFDGDIRTALDLLDEVEPWTTGADRGRLLTQRGIILYWHGDLEDALASYHEALVVLQDTDDRLAEARLHVNFGALLSYVARFSDARTHLEQATRLATALGQTLIGASAEHNLGHVEVLSGDLPAAFRAFDRAAELYRQANVEAAWLDNLHIDHARALLQANLLDESDAMATETLRRTDEKGPSPATADLLYLLAQIRLAKGDMTEGREVADRSKREFERSERPAWALLAEALALRIAAIGAPGRTIARNVADAAIVLDAIGYRDEGLRTAVVAARAHARAGDVAAAERLLAVLRSRLVGASALDRAAAQHVWALCAERRGDRSLARRRVRRGLQTFVDNASSMGAIELRARAAANGEALATLGVRLAILDRRPRELLDRTEAMRLALVSVLGRDPGSAIVRSDLAELRRLASELRTAEPGPDRQRLERARVGVERRIREHTRQARSNGDAATTTIHDALAALGDHVLLEYAAVDGRLYAVTVSGGRAQLHELGPTDRLAEDIDSCTFALYRLNRAQVSTASKVAARATLVELGDRLTERLVPGRVRRSERPVVVVPTGALHGLVWGALPGLAGRPVSVSPSLVGWAVAEAAAARVSSRRSVLLAAGPELPAAPTEIEALAPLYRRPTVLVGEAATSDAVLDGLGRSRLAHLACHGAYRADNPLFSTLTLADGPLTVYDLERCRTMPRTVVLSACTVATSAVLRGGTLLGLASALMTFGVSTVIAPLTPVSDERAASVMVDLHKAMVEGASPAAALAVSVAGGEGELDATAAAFLAIGA